MKCVSYLSDFLTVFNERKNVTNKTRSPRTESDQGAVSSDTGAVTRLPVQHASCSTALELAMELREIHSALSQLRIY